MKTKVAFNNQGDYTNTRLRNANKVFISYRDIINAVFNPYRSFL